MADPMSAIAGGGLQQLSQGMARRSQMPQPPGMQDYANNMNGRAQMLRDQGMSEQQVVQNMKQYQAQNPPPTFGSAMQQRMMPGLAPQQPPMMGVQGGPQFNSGQMGIGNFMQQQMNPMAQRQQMMAQFMRQQPAPMNSNPGNLGLLRPAVMPQQGQMSAAVMPHGDMRRGALMDLAKQGAPKPGMMYAGGSPGMGLARPGVMRRG